MESIETLSGNWVLIIVPCDHNEGNYIILPVSHACNAMTLCTLTEHSLYIDLVINFGYELDDPITSPCIEYR